MSPLPSVRFALFALLPGLAALPCLPGQTDGWREAAQAGGLDVQFRNAGPAVMGGRVVDLAVVESDPRTFFVAAASGGLWKTENGGLSFRPVLAEARTSSLGAVAVSGCDPGVVWAGMGEANARNSVTWGDGVYVSMDGGATFESRGLKDTRHIGRIAPHPLRRGVAFVAALGHIWSPNLHRGLYLTEDYGRTWSQVLRPDPDTGCVDVRICPGDPDIVLAAAYRVRRGPNDANDPDVRHGDMAGIYRSADGGRTWERVTAGLPGVPFGRVGLDFCRNPGRTAYAVVETSLTGQAPPFRDGPDPAARPYLGIRSEDGDRGARLLEVVERGAAAAAGLLPDDVVVELDGRSVVSSRTLTAAIQATVPGQAVSIRARRGAEILAFTAAMGAAPPEPARGPLGGQIENAQDRQGSGGFETGGVFRSDDAGLTWRRVNSLAPRPFYFSKIRVDPSDPERVWVLGIQCYRSSDGGATFSNDAAPLIHVDHHAMWIDPEDGRHILIGNDGGVARSYDRGASFEFLNSLDICQFYGISLDDRQPYWIYGGLQDNGSWAFPSRTRGRAGLTNDLPFKIGGGDGFLCEVDPADNDTVYWESQNGGIARTDLRTGATRRVARPRAAVRQGSSESEARVRFNWKTPFKLSPFNSRILYFAGHRVMRSVNRGDTSVFISGEITRTGRGAATALAVSPLEEGVLYAGTEEGSLWVTRDDGANWTPLHENLPLLDRLKWVAHIEVSRHERGVAYVVLDGHRTGDLRPAIFRTADYGATFRDISDGLPPVSTRVLREDPVNPRLLYAGHETGASFSLDGGAGWCGFRGGLPVAAVHDIRIHERDRELVLATHGRGVWIANAAPLQELRDGALPAERALFVPATAVAYTVDGRRSAFGDQGFRGGNPAPGADIAYWLPEAMPEGRRMEVGIRSLDGSAIRTLQGPGRRGLNIVRWDFARTPQGRARTGAFAGAGMYVVAIDKGDGEEVARHLEVLPDPGMGNPERSRP